MSVRFSDFLMWTIGVCCGIGFTFHVANVPVEDARIVTDLLVALWVWPTLGWLAIGGMRRNLR